MTANPETTNQNDNELAVAHPLEMLTPAEVDRTRSVLRDSGRLPEGALFASIVLHEPAKDVLAAVEAGRPRRAPHARGDRPRTEKCGVVEAIVDVGAGVIEAVGRDRRACAPRC